MKAAFRPKASDVRRVDSLSEDGVKADVPRPKGIALALPNARRSLARKIIAFNLLSLLVLAFGLLILLPSRSAMIAQKEAALAAQAQLIAPLLPSAEAVQSLELAQGVEASFVDRQGEVTFLRQAALVEGETPFTPFADLIFRLWAMAAASPSVADMRDTAIATSLKGEASSHSTLAPDGAMHFAAANPYQGGALLLVAQDRLLDGQLRLEHERIIQLFLLAAALALVLSLLLAATIANPLAKLAAAAEITREADGADPRVNLPDLTDRPDEIGRLSLALRGMVNALYDRIESNEQFAADVSHEIKNPLASLRSAVGSLRMVKKPEHRDRLLEVIEHDVRRMDRLVSDISNASRLDSELVKEQEEEFNLLQMLHNLTDYLGQQAQAQGVDFLTDFPQEPIRIHGLEPRLAQVFVNLITNAISFCEKGDAVRVWVRRRDARVLVVVEDTGPGIPEEALTKIFKRFYSDRPASHFGNNSGLGLSISKQIVEAHGGVIWAENIRLAHAPLDQEPLGARFVVGLPL